MLNLVKTNTCDGLISKSAKISDTYIQYLSRKLFYALGEQDFFCPNCGGTKLDPRNFEEIKYCPKCGESHGFKWGWDCNTRLNLTISILINNEPKTVSIIILLLEKIAKQHGIKINWYINAEDGIILI